MFKKGGGDRKICKQQMWRRRRVQGQGGWCCWFRGEKEAAGDGLVGAGPCSKVGFSNGCHSFQQLVHVAGWHSSEPCFQPLGLLVAGEDFLLQHISAGLVLGGGKMSSWAKAKEWRKDSWGFISGPNAGVRFAGVI